MSIRDKIKKGVKEAQVKSVEYIDLGWYVGDDIPITWDLSELKKIKKKVLRLNWKRGVINTKTYKILLKKK